MTSVEVGRQLAGRYQILGLLGRGAMGVVHRAHDKVLDREVAIKTIRLDVLEPGRQAMDFRARFLREAQAAARLHHPNVVTIFDAGEVDGVMYMAIELIEGPTLEGRLHQEGPALALDECLDIAIQLCQGLEEAHAQGIIHRDIKPGNVMLARGGRAKITDFGIARIESMGTLTREGMIAGTPSYMSPEQLRGQPLDGRADVFALGAVLYEMVTGLRAFDGDSLTAIVLKVINDEPRPMRERNAGVPSDPEEVVKRALAKDVSLRFAGMAELRAPLLAARAAMARAAHGCLSESDTHRLETVTAPAPAVGRRGGWRSRRGRLGAGLAATALLVTLASLGARGGPVEPQPAAAETATLGSPSEPPPPAPTTELARASEPPAQAPATGRSTAAGRRAPTPAAGTSRDPVVHLPRPAAPAPTRARPPAITVLAEDERELAYATNHISGTAPDRSTASAYLEQARVALRESGDRAAFHLALGRFYAHQRSLHVASRTLEQAAEIAPDRPEPYELLASVYEGLGKDAKARKARERSAELRRR